MRRKSDRHDALEWAREEQAKSDPRISRLEQENARLSKLLGLVESYHSAASAPPQWARRVAKPRPSQATACLQLSDLHLDETVRPEEVGGLNGFDRPIAETRLRRWASKAVEMGERHKHDWDGALLFMGGDMVSGQIHDELVATNADYLPSTLAHWAPLLAAAVKQVADYYGSVHIPAITGNHGRLTVKKQAKGRARNSADWLLYTMIRSHLVSDSRITWDIAEGSYLFVECYGRTFYLTHGDEVGGGGGWAGIWSPLGTIHRKGIEIAAAHNKRISASVVGHWHQTTLAHARGLVCNGSLKGWDEYAASLRLRPESAMQNFWIETPDHGTTLAGALFLEDRKAEGW